MAGLTQKQLAEALGLASDRAVRAWENGDYAPGIHHALPLARVLGVSLQEVVTAVAGPDPGPITAPSTRTAGSAVPSADGGSLEEGSPHVAVPPDTLAALSYHVAALARLVRQLEQGQRLKTEDDAAAHQQPADDAP